MLTIDDKIIEHYLRQYLTLYWLRPGTALWRAIDALYIRAHFPLSPPCLDLGCGDGCNTYILQGESLPPEYDAFLSMADAFPASFLNGQIDIYADSRVELPALPPPKHRVDCGLDLKDDLLQKARSLNLYRKLVQHDANLPMPFESETFVTIYSNSLCWIENLDFALSEIRRTLKRNGRVLLQVPTPELAKHYIYRFFEGEGWNWAKLLDMGRHAHIKHYLTPAVWEKKIKTAGLEVVQAVSYLSGRLIEITELDLRPISPVLAKMANLLTKSNRSEIKSEWIAYLMPLATSLFERGWILDEDGPQTFVFYELRKA